MSYLVLARKYRPAGFDAVSGQEHVTKTLRNALLRDKVAHAYVFAGPRGVGKTSIARIFAKALNCEKGLTPEPCLKCKNCLEINQGTSFAVREIDGASHNSVDDVRDLIDSFRALPPAGYRYKVYIIDEVHMLSTAAFNALLKSLEEPPPHTVFMLATTEVHKIPDTVLSRCQRHELRALPLAMIEARLKEIAKSEKFQVEQEALQMIARLSDGSMRDAQSLLDRVTSFCDDKVTAAEASKVLGVVERKFLLQLAEAIIQRNPRRALEIVNEAFSGGVDTSLALKEFAHIWRDLLVTKVSAERDLVQFGIDSELSTQLKSLVGGIEETDLYDLTEVAFRGADSALRSFLPKFSFESLVARMASREPVRSIATLISKIDNIGGRGSIPAVPEKQSKTIVSQNPAPQPHAPTLDWSDFVKSAQKSSKMLTEHLKRLALQKFEKGTLEARGPLFSVQALKREDNKKLLQELLGAYSMHADWRVTLLPISEEDQGVTIHHQEKQHEVHKIEERKKVAASHPSIKSLQKAFPGSKIESIQPIEE